MPDGMSAQLSTTHVDAVTQALEGAGVDYLVDEHIPTFSAAAEARVERVPSDRVAKTVVLRLVTGWALAVIPASHRLELRKMRELLGTGSDLRLATEGEMKEHFPQFDVGAVPPVGSVVPAEVIDRRLLDHERVLFAAGDHRHSVLADPKDLVRLSQATVGDICED